MCMCACVCVRMCVIVCVCVCVDQKTGLTRAVDQVLLAERDQFSSSVEVLTLQRTSCTERPTRTTLAPQCQGAKGQKGAWYKRHVINGATPNMNTYMYTFSIFLIGSFAKYPFSPSLPPSIHSSLPPSLSLSLSLSSLPPYLSLPPSFLPSLPPSLPPSLSLSLSLSSTQLNSTITLTPSTQNNNMACLCTYVYVRTCTQI